MPSSVGGEEDIAAQETRSRRLIHGTALLFLAVVMGALAAQIHFNRQEQAHTLAAATAAKARAYEQAMARQVELFDVQLQILQHEWQDDRAGFPASIARLRYGSLRGYEVSVAVVDAHGVVAFYDAPGFAARSRQAPLNVEDRDYFRFFQQTPANLLYVGGVAPSRLTGRMVLPFARPLLDGRGTLLGVICLIVYPDYLNKLGGFVDLDPADRLVVLDRYGRVANGNAGQPPGQLPPEIMRPAAGRPTGAELRGDGVLAWRTLRDYPFTILLQNDGHELRRHQGALERSYVLIAGLPLLGMFAGVGFLLRDVRRRSRMLRELVRSELMAASVVDAMAEGVMRIDPAGVIRAANGAACRILAMDEDRLVGLSALSEDWQVIHPDGRECRVDELPTTIALRTGAPQANATLGFVRADGSRVWLNLSTRLLPREAGGGVLASFADVTALMDRALEARLGSAVVQSMAQAVVVTNQVGTIVRINPAFEELYGYGERDALGRRAGFYRSDRHDREFYRAMWRDLAERGHWQGEVWNRHRDGRALLVWASIDAVRDENGQVAHYVALYQDITEKKHAENEMWFGANHDALTRLPNRRLFQDRLDKALAVAERSAEKVGLLFVDLDRFKPVNDTYGHAVGDALLVLVAQRLNALVRGSDTVARLAGDEFVVLLAGVAGAADVRRVADGVVAEIARPFDVNGLHLEISASVGVVFFPDHGRDVDTLLHIADQAMYRAKAAGRNGYVVADIAPA